MFPPRSDVIDGPRNPRPCRIATSFALCVAVLLGLITSAIPASAATQWIKGPLRADKVLDCPIFTSTGKWVYGDGFGGQVSYEDDPSTIMTVGQRFYARFQVRLVTIPCVEAGVLPEFILPNGMEFAEDAAHPVRWSISGGDKPAVSGTDKELVFDRGRYGGLLVGTSLPKYSYKGTGIWHLQRADGVLEIKIPMKTTRPMKGDQSRIPDCYTTNAGAPGVKFYYPCSPDKAGDHLQVGMTVMDGGDRRENSVHVGVFARDRAQTQVPSAVSATFADNTITTAQAASLRVLIKASRTATGTITVKDGSRTLRTVSVTAASLNRVTITLPRLAAGRHSISVSYAGSPAVKASRTTVGLTVSTAKVASRTTARFVDSTITSKVRAKLSVVVSASKPATGTITVKEGARLLARVSLSAAHRGKAAVTLPRLAAGKHRVVVAYSGSSALTASSAAAVVSVSR